MWSGRVHSLRGSPGMNWEKPLSPLPRSARASFSSVEINTFIASREGNTLGRDRPRKTFMNRDGLRPATDCAKRLECVRLAGALARGKSGSQLASLQTLARPYIPSVVRDLDAGSKIRPGYT